MFTFSLQNKYGQQVELTHSDKWTVKSIEGLDPPDAVLNMSKDAGVDGSVFNSAFADNRQIIVTLAINSEAENNRIELYRYVKTKQEIRVLYQNGTRNVYIDGYIKSMHVGFFEMKQVAQITIICPDPYFKDSDSEEIELASQNRMFEFPFSIEEPIPFSEIISILDTQVDNPGDVETGVVIRMKARGTVTNPIIYNKNGDYFKLNITMTAEQEIVISTIKKQKSVTLIDTEGTKTNVVGKIAQGSDWLTLDPADNYISVGADSGAVYIDTWIQLTALYEGV